MKSNERDNKFGVLAWPAYANKASNPYNYLIYSNAEKEGYPVYEFDFNIKNILRFLYSRKYSIFHIHWPTNILTYSTYWQAKRRVIMLKYFLIIIKLFNKKVVWTVHNILGHESSHPSLQKDLNNVLYTYTDAFISLNKSGLKYIKAKALNKEKQIFAYIPHLSYSEYYPDIISKQDARKQLNITDDKFVFLFLGQIRKYKNIFGLVKAFKKVNIDNKFLLIAGKAHEELAEDLIKETENHSDILLKDGFVADNDLQIYLNACDLVVTPYSSIFNSGSVFLNLSFNKPTLAPKKGVFTELEKEIGNDFILLYDGKLSSIHLHSSIQKLKGKSSEKLDLSRFYPENIAKETILLYQKLLKR